MAVLDSGQGLNFTIGNQPVQRRVVAALITRSEGVTAEFDHNGSFDPPTLLLAESTNTFDSGARRAVALFESLIPAGHGSVAYGGAWRDDGGGTVTARILWMLLDEDDTYTFVDAVPNDTDTGSSSSLELGPTAEAPAGDALVVPCAVQRGDSTTSEFITASTEVVYDNGAGNNALYGGIGYNGLTSQPAQTYSDVWDIDNFRQISGIIAVWSTGSGGGTAVGQAVEADQALTITSTKTRAAGLAASTEQAQSITASKALDVDQASESEAALSITAVKHRQLGQAVEIETALGVTLASGTPVSQATETDTAQPITAAKTRTVEQAVETEQARSAVPVKSRAAGVAETTEAALPVTAVKTHTVGLAVETDTALVATVSGGAEIEVPPWRTSRALPEVRTSRALPEPRVSTARAEPRVSVTL